MIMDQQHSPDEAASKARLRLWLRILKISRLSEARLRQQFKTGFNTTLPRFDVMAALSQHKDGLKMSELSKLLRVSNGNVTGIIDRLVDEGLVLRVTFPGDRRASLVRLSAKGETLFVEQARAHEGWVDELLGMVSAEEARHMSDLLAEIATKLEGTGKDERSG